MTHTEGKGRAPAGYIEMPFKLSFRETQGSTFNCYIAETASDEIIIHLGAIRGEGGDEILHLYKELMQLVFKKAFRDVAPGPPMDALSMIEVPGKMGKPEGRS